MTKIPEVKLETLRKIPPDDLHLLWVNDGDGGPLEAVVAVAGEPCLMVLHDEDAGAQKPYRWLLIPLSEAQRAEEEKWHAMFVACIGDHWCFHGAAILHPPQTEEPDPEKFYEAYRHRPPLDMTRNVVCGWADEIPQR